MTGKTRTYWFNTDPNVRHGTTYAYYHKGCRCDDCLDAWRAYHQRRKQEDPDYMARRARDVQRWRQRQAAERLGEALS